ncbi:MAG: hypothetical protein GY947_12770 [Rhodobacteraceae bacterium]|nr:hypothetical protein [Paracoccaceae bacterium]
MRLHARLFKLERAQTESHSDLRKLTDEELVERLRASAEKIGIDWETYKNDPQGTIRKHFEGMSDDDGLIEGLLQQMSKVGADWLNGSEACSRGRTAVN